MITPLVIFFAQYRDDKLSASGFDPVFSLLQLTHVLFAAGVALTEHRYVV
jgi:hypothetical protein